MDSSRKKLLRQAFEELRGAARRALNEEDPIGLIEAGFPEDEYDPEVGTILPRLHKARSAEDVTRIVHEEFARWFGEPAFSERYARAGQPNFNPELQS